MSEWEGRGGPPDEYGGMRTCPECLGAGVELLPDVMGNIIVRSSVVCDHCDGDGEILESLDFYGGVGEGRA